MALKVKTPPMASMDGKPTVPVQKPIVPSSDPSKAGTRENLNVTFGAPKKQE